MEYVYTKYPVNVAQLVDEILKSTGLLFGKLNASDIVDGNIAYSDFNDADNLTVISDIALSQGNQNTIDALIAAHVANTDYNPLDWARRRDVLLPFFYAEAGAQLQNFSGMSNAKKLNACVFFMVPYNVRIQIISDAQDAKNWDFLLTMTKQSREACVEAMRIKVGQYMRLGTISLAQTQDFYTQVYQLIIWFNDTNKPDFKQWISNEVGSPYENAGFAQQAYYNVDIKNDLMDIYNGNY